jgi:hypothetical protein
LNTRNSRSAEFFCLSEAVSKCFCFFPSFVASFSFRTSLLLFLSDIFCFFFLSKFGSVLLAPPCSSSHRCTEVVPPSCPVYAQKTKLACSGTAPSSFAAPACEVARRLHLVHCVSLKKTLSSTTTKTDTHNMNHHNHHHHLLLLPIQHPIPCLCFLSVMATTDAL